jgi:hypothetical protein
LACNGFQRLKNLPALLIADQLWKALDEGILVTARNTPLPGASQRSLKAGL